MRGKAPVIIGLMFAFLWIAGLDATAQQNCPSTPPTGDSAPPPPECLSPTPSTPPPSIPATTHPPTMPPTTAPPCPVPPCVILPSDTPSFPPSDPPPTGPPPPITGADLTRFVLIGAGLTLAGTGIVRLTRKVRSDES